MALQRQSTKTEQNWTGDKSTHGQELSRSEVCTAVKTEFMLFWVAES